MHVALEGLLAGIGLAILLVLFEYTAISREVAERSKRLAKKVEWDSNQKSRMRGIINFGLILPIGGAAIAWLVWG